MICLVIHINNANFKKSDKETRQLLYNTMFGIHGNGGVIIEPCYKGTVWQKKRRKKDVTVSYPKPDMLY